MARHKMGIESYTDFRRFTANARERIRMHNLNAALDRLRRHLPAEINFLGKVRLSKFETLKLACNYITALSESLERGRQMTSTTLCHQLCKGLGSSKVKICPTKIIRKRQNPQKQNCLQLRNQSPDTTEDSYQFYRDIYILSSYRQSAFEEAPEGRMSPVNEDCTSQSRTLLKIAEESTEQSESLCEG